MEIVGISSSPIVNGNVDRMVQNILKRVNSPSYFVNLTKLSFSPCMGCAHLCAKDNLCKLDDDLKPLYSKILQADALVLGTPSYFDDINGFMRIFLERLWSFRHLRFPLKGKPYIVIASGGIQIPLKAIESVKNRMNAYKGTFLNSIAFNSTIIPCFTCGYGTKCSVGASQYVYGEKARKNLNISEDSFKKWEDCSETVDKITTVVKEMNEIVNLPE